MTFIGGLTGMAVGSFLGVVVDRQVSGVRCQVSGIGGRSRCGSCRRQLTWWENIPILSFILLRGRCRTCRSPIPYWLPLIELAGAAAGAAIAAQIGQISPIGLIGLILVAVALVWVFFSDLVNGLVPDSAVILGSFGAVLEKFAKLPITFESFANFFMAAVMAAGFFRLLVIVTRGKGMGMGDVTLAFFLGLWLGWPKILAGVWLGFLIGAVWAIGLILLGRKKFGQTIPFGPFLICGSLLAARWGDYLLDKLR